MRIVVNVFYGRLLRMWVGFSRESASLKRDRRKNQYYGIGRRNGTYPRVCFTDTLIHGILLRNYLESAILFAGEVRKAVGVSI